MMIWAIFYKLNQFPILLKPHALSFQLTVTPPPSPKVFSEPKVFKRNEFRVCVLFLFACVCAYVHAGVCIISMCVLFLSLCVCVSVPMCADAPVYAGVYYKCTLPQFSSPVFVHFRTKDNFVCLTLCFSNIWSVV